MTQKVVRAGMGKEVSLSARLVQAGGVLQTTPSSTRLQISDVADRLCDDLVQWNC